MFWGLFFIVLGTSMVLQHTLNIDIPLMKILLGFFIIYIGIKVLLGSFGIHVNVGDNKKGTAVFRDKTEFNYVDDKWSDDKAEYNTVFSTSVIDLTKIPSDEKEHHIEINTVFGNSTIYVEKNRTVEFRTTTVFGRAQLPNQVINGFGDFTYNSPEAPSGNKKLIVRLSVVFGKVKVIEK